MTREEVIERLKETYTELSMSPKEYVEYANNRYVDGYKVTLDNAFAFRTGVVKERINSIIFALDQESKGIREGGE